MHININGFDFNGFNMDSLELHIEMKLGNTVIRSQRIQMPYQMMLAQCQAWVNEIAQDSRPMKITMSGHKDIQLPDGDWVSKPSKLIYTNNAYTENFDMDEV